jgi:hypothetical protein
LIDLKRTDPIRDHVKPVSAMEKVVEKPRANLDHRVADSIGANTFKIKRKPLPDVVPPKRSEGAVHSTKVHTPTANSPSDGTCDLRRRGAVRVYADVSQRVPADIGPVPSPLEDIERRVREVRRIVMMLEK